MVQVHLLLSIKRAVIYCTMLRLRPNFRFLNDLGQLRAQF